MLLKRIYVLFFAILTSLIPQPSSAFTAGTVQNEDVIVLFEKDLNPSAAEEAARLYPGLKHNLEKVFGWKIHFRPTIILFSDTKRFQKTTSSHLFVAYAIPGKNIMVIDYTKMRTDPFSIEATLKHELCHLLLHSHIPKGALPKWLDEGVAQWISGGLADILLTQKNSRLNRAILSKHYIPFSALSEQFPGDKNSLILAYEESRSLVEYIVHEHGTMSLLTILDRLKNGDHLDDAVQKAISISFGELERKWYNKQQSRNIWLFFLMNHIYEILFFFASLTLIYGFIRAFLKKRAYQQYEEETK